MATLKTTAHGFEWDQVKITRLASVERSNGTYWILKLNDLEIYVSPSGRTRVFRIGVGELTKQPDIKELSRPEDRLSNRPDRRECDTCGKSVAIHINGRLYTHGRNGTGYVCPGN